MREGPLCLRAADTVLYMHVMSRNASDHDRATNTLVAEASHWHLTIPRAVQGRSCCLQVVFNSTTRELGKPESPTEASFEHVTNTLWVSLSSITRAHSTRYIPHL